jgi:hypothetical protein
MSVAHLAAILSGTALSSTYISDTGASIAYILKHRDQTVQLFSYIKSIWEWCGKYCCYLLVIIESLTVGLLCTGRVNFGSILMFNMMLIQAICFHMILFRLLLPLLMSISITEYIDVTASYLSKTSGEACYQSTKLNYGQYLYSLYNTGILLLGLPKIDSPLKVVLLALLHKQKTAKKVEGIGEIEVD